MTPTPTPDPEQPDLAALTGAGTPTFIGPDSQVYAYVDPDQVPSMDDVDSTTVPAPEGAPTEEPLEAAEGESTPTKPALS